MALKEQIADLDKQLYETTSYTDWREIASEMDRLEGRLDWLEEDESEQYSWRLIRNRLNELKHLRQHGDVRELIFWLHEGLHGNLGNMANPALYAYTRVGTKSLINEYVSEVVAVLEYLCDNDFEEIDLGEKIRIFKRIGKCFGRSGLLLSGGATLGMFHIGVTKTLWEENLLPRVFSGSSAGSIIAGAMATHTDEEIPALFDPEYLYLQAFKPAQSLKKAWKKRALMDGDQLSHCLQENMGDYTFEEAFQKTGRIINIPVSPVASNQMPRLLNYLTAPNVLIRSGSLASCSIPTVFPAVRLLAKDYNGNILPYLPSMKWADGSLKSDLPMLRMARLHDVNHYIVSQTNPHVAPFMSGKVKKSSPKGLFPFAAELAANSIEAQGKQLLKTARKHVSTPVLKRVLDEAHTITNQTYSGDVTLVPPFKPRLMAKTLTNPTPEDIRVFMHDGAHMTYPHIERIRNASLISQTLENCIRKLKIDAHQSPAGVQTPRAQLRKVS